MTLTDILSDKYAFYGLLIAAKASVHSFTFFSPFELTNALVSSIYIRIL